MWVLLSQVNGPRALCQASAWHKIAYLITLRINDRLANVPSGITVAAAMAIAGELATRTSVTGEPRGPLCGMGICFECRVIIDGRPHCRACQTEALDGMKIQTQ